MFGFFDRMKPHPVDLPIKQVLDEMEMSDPEAEKYSDYVDYLERLHKLKREERQTLVSPDTVVVVLGNLLGILIIVGYEQKHVITSKAQQFSLKSNPQINQL